MRSTLMLFAVLVFTSMLMSCNEQGKKNINQGEIHYTIDYQGDMGSVPKEVLPKTLVVSFKDDKTLFEMVSPFGNSGIQNLTNPEQGIYDTYFSLFTIKYFYAAKPGEIFPGFESMSGVKLKKTSKTSLICGFNCKNVQAEFPDKPGKVYDLWYTDEIDVKGSNASTPFADIDGVLMSFFFFLGNSELHFTAETVYQKEIPDDTFERKEKFQRISREDINKFISKMISI